MSFGVHSFSISAFRIFVLLFLIFSPLGAWAIPQSEAQPTTSPVKADPSAGKPIFERYCSSCHGLSGDGGRGPRLNRAYLQHAPDDDHLRLVISNGIPPSMPDAYYLTEAEIANVAAHIRSLAKLPGEIPVGNADRGGAIYARAGCASCHIHNGQGFGYGPELTAIGSRRSVAFLKGILENPASELPEGFLMVTAVTRSGRPVTGIRTNEDTFTVQIRDNGGKLYSFRKNNLRQLTRQNGKTPMPPFALSPSDLRDLVAFLVASK